MSLRVAIVGSGPSGFYTADSLLRAREDVTVDIIERLPSPYGLIRGGVAPDHAKTKNVARAYEKTAQDPRVRFFGHVEAGKDVSIAELRRLYDAVVLATGAAVDRKLGVPGEDLPGVFGVAAFVGWYNGHPDFRDLDPDLNVDTALVIGVGNVAVDVARVLAKTPAEMAATDLAAHAASAIHASPIGDIYMVGRRGPLDARFTNVELREMGELTDAVPLIDPAVLPEAVPPAVVAHRSERDVRLIERNLATLRGFLDVDPAGKSKRVHFRFFANPQAILGEQRVEGVRFEITTVSPEGKVSGTGETFDIPCGLVIPAIGYSSDPIDGVPFEGGRTKNANGRIERGLYAVGWAKRGPSGVIGSNKPDGEAAAHQIVEDLAHPKGLPGGDGLRRLLDERGVEWIDFDDWKQIEAAEISAAKDGAPRAKFSRVEDMLDVVRSNRKRGASTAKNLGNQGGAVV